MSCRGKQRTSNRLSGQRESLTTRHGRDISKWQCLGYLQPCNSLPPPWPPTTHSLSSAQQRVAFRTNYSMPGRHHFGALLLVELAARFPRCLPACLPASSSTTTHTYHSHIRSDSTPARATLKSCSTISPGLRDLPIIRSVSRPVPAPPPPPPLSPVRRPNIQRGTRQGEKNKAKEKKKDWHGSRSSRQVV